MPIAPRLLETLDSLHEESPQVLDGSLSLADFWSRMGEVEDLLKRACSTLAPLFGGGEGEALRLVSHLFAEESYLAFHEFVSPTIVGRLRERGDTLDA